MKVDELEVRYRGERAREYDDIRSGGTKWSAEQVELTRLADQIRTGSRVLDVPVGTGRFAELLIGRDLDFLGIDISEDMIAEARKKVEGDDRFAFRTGSIFDLPLEDDEVDVAFCIRFLNWIDIAKVELALNELQRVTRDQIVVTIRTYLRVSDIRSPRDLERMVRKIAGVPGRRTGDTGLVIHREGELLDAVRGAGLEIVERKVIQKRSDGTNYQFLRLATACK